MVRLIDEHRARYGVEPMCAVLPMAPSTYFRDKACETHPEQRSGRARSGRNCDAMAAAWRDAPWNA